MNSWINIPTGSPFPVTNLPFGLGHTGDGRWRIWVAVGDSALNIEAVAQAGFFDGIDVPDRCFQAGSLNAYLAAGPEVWAAVRTALGELLTDPAAERALSGAVFAQSALTMGLPVRPVDYVDFYSSLHHATNLGRLFRPDGDALMPNWKQIPIGYHGRTGTLVPDGFEIRRPHGMRLIDGTPEYGPCRLLDIELEVGTVVGVGSAIGEPIAIDNAAQHLYGMCLVNDWSARDIQGYEYVPLGPFLGKSFATSVSPWLVSFEALAPFMTDPMPQDQPVADYLRTDAKWGVDLHLEVALESAQMRAEGVDPFVISATDFADMYWTPAQQLAHMTVNGASTSTGDLFASGTVSGPTQGSEGSLIELTWRGERPISLPDGTTRTFLQDGDRVELRGWAGSDPASRIGLGSVSGTIAG